MKLLYLIILGSIMLGFFLSACCTCNHRTEDEIVRYLDQVSPDDAQVVRAIIMEKR